MKKNISELQFAEGEQILINKPYGWSSFAVVAQLKKWTKAKIGHAGTLDPLATGLLILCTGKKTKSITQLIGLKKEYTGIIQLGSSTPTYDLESTPENFHNTNHLTQDVLQQIIQQFFLGECQQLPPLHSAIKQNGTPLYEMARKGKQVNVTPRKIIIEQFEITQFKNPEIHFRIVCSSGTYIRSIAHDIGLKANVGGHLKQLTRTKIGDFELQDAYTITELANHFGSQMNVIIIQPKSII